MRRLPYPGHSWSFTQHAVGIEANTLYAFLGCAALHEGQRDPGPRITESMIAAGILTANNREGVDDAWRDYQQILAELGLIYSTAICPSLRLTEIGHLFLAAEIGFSELIGIQALRYQYPNGQKSTIQSRLRQELNNAGHAIPGTVIELQTQSGLLIKPGLLILRILIALRESNAENFLSLSECQAFLVPCLRNADWNRAFKEIIQSRKRDAPLQNENAHSRRNVSDWFRLLEKTDLFTRDRDFLSLSDSALGNLASLLRVCEHEEDPATFWIPASYDAGSRVSWFDWYGQMAYSVQEITNHPIDSTYIERNYVAGAEDEEWMVAESRTPYVVLSEIDLENLSREREFSPVTVDDAELLRRINLGLFRRHSKTLLHDRIVASVASVLQATGATVSDDRNSVDILAVWPDSTEAIFEIKTVMMRSLQNRLRMAVGQIEEYAYRRRSQGNSTPDKVIVVNTDISSESWHVDFLVRHMNIGLICTSLQRHFGTHIPVNARTAHHWPG